MSHRIALVHPSLIQPYMYESAVKNNIEFVLIMPEGVEVTHHYDSVIGVEFVPMYDKPNEALDRMLELHQYWKFDGIIAGKDHGVIFTAQAATKLGLRGLSPDVAKNARSKILMRTLFEEAGLTVPKFVGIAGSAEVELCKDIPFPCVVKPASGVSSDCVQMVSNRAELLAACEQIERANEKTWNGCSMIEGGNLAGIIVEEYLVGEEFAVELFAYNGEVFALNCGYKGHPTGPHFEETVYLSPPVLPAQKIREIQAAAVAGMKALKLDNGAGHCELRLNGEGKPVILEIGARMGGGGCAQLNVEASSGIDYANLVFRNALGDLGDDIWPPKPDNLGRAGSMWIVPMRGHGTLHAIHGLGAVEAHPDCERVIKCSEPGRVYRPLPDFDGFLALIFGTHESPEAGERFYQFLEDTVTVEWRH